MKTINVISKETEKAIAFKAWKTDTLNYRRTFQFDFWCPKSCINEDGSIKLWFMVKKVREAKCEGWDIILEIA